LVGRWELIDYVISDEVLRTLSEADRAILQRQLNEGLVSASVEMEFFADGTGVTIGTSAGGNPIRERFEWVSENGLLKTTTGNRHTLSRDPGMEYRISGSRLTLSDDSGIDAVFKRVGR
jgi:hypothetical protein